MKTKIALLIALTLIIALALLTGCASFSSTQEDLSYEKGLPSRTITTKTKARTLWSAKSDLARYKALTTDKTQSLGIGGLNQEATNNLEVIVGAAVGAAVSAAKRP